MTNDMDVGKTSRENAQFARMHDLSRMGYQPLTHRADADDAENDAENLTDDTFWTRQEQLLTHFNYMYAVHSLKSGPKDLLGAD